jgi:hypothetical protein
VSAGQSRPHMFLRVFTQPATSRHISLVFIPYLSPGEERDP